MGDTHCGWRMLQADERVVRNLDRTANRQNIVYRRTGSYRQAHLFLAIKAMSTLVNLGDQMTAMQRKRVYRN
jgi:hypothetical protein